MARFEVRGVGRDSGRTRRRSYKARNESEAVALAKKGGMIVKAVSPIPDEPATARQRAYAADLGLSFPDTITKAEMGDLLDKHLSRDKPSSERHREFARWFGVGTTAYVGKRALFDRIGAELSRPGREEDLCAWFVYRVCRHVCRGGEDHPRATGPNSVAVYEMGAELASDPSVLRSIRRYEGRDLIWFGEWTSPDGYVHEGASVRTMAYKRARSLIRDRLGM